MKVSMKFLNFQNESKGQALILVIVILVIIAMIATSVAFRTISDTRRTGDERASLDAFTYAESAIEDVSNQMKICLSEGKETDDCLTSICGNPTECSIKCEAGSSCPILEDFSETECNKISVLLKGVTDVEGRVIPRDDVLEISVSSQGVVPINITWEGAILEVIYVSYSQATGYSISETAGREYYLNSTGSFSSGAAPTDAIYTVNNGSITIPGSKLVGLSLIRLKAIGGDAVLDVTGVTEPFEVLYSANGFCGNVSRNVVVVEPILESLDGIFDYVLYANVINKHVTSTKPPLPTGVCGDGVVNGTGEECDDGNTNNFDTCTNLCKRRCPFSQPNCGSIF
jgi:cysteine-rich repeat protein